MNDELNGRHFQTDQKNGHPALNHEPSSFASEGTIEIRTESTSAKRKLDAFENGSIDHQDKRRKGTAPIKQEYLILDKAFEDIKAEPDRANNDDDAAEAFHHQDRSAGRSVKNQRKKQKGQNKAREVSVRFSSSLGATHSVAERLTDFQGAQSESRMTGAQQR